MRILYVTTIGRTMRFFNPIIQELIREGNVVHIATNENNSPVPDCYREWGCIIHQISTSRSPVSKGNVKAFKQLREVIKNGNYDVVHCHTPNASVITRLVCRKFRKKNGLKVFYTAHGFHFYKGAPRLNWMVYYPVERFCSRFTDKLITINKEDYELAKTKFMAKEVCYVPGVGINLSRFQNIEVDRAAKRREIGVPEDAFLLLSVGELNENKNHQIIIRAMAKLDNPSIHYAIAGTGDKHDYLLSLASELGVSDQLHLLGYRKDIPELNCSADIFCFPSLREGLGLAAIEAMACGLPLVTSNIHGINDYSENGVTGYKCDRTDVDGFAFAISKLMSDQTLCNAMAINNVNLSNKYGVETIVSTMKNIYD